MGSYEVSLGYGPCLAIFSSTLNILSVLTLLLVAMRLRTSDLLPITAISYLLQFIPLSEAVSVPKIDVQLEGNTNYKRWALVVKGTLVVMGLWYAVIKPKPSPQTGAAATPGGTATGTLNQKKMEDWDEANDSA